MPLVHLVGDPDTDGDRMLRGKVNKNVFVGSGTGMPGSALSNILGVPHLDTITPGEEREILEVLATAPSLGINTDEIELFDDIYEDGSDPVTGDQIVEPGSPAASGGISNTIGATAPVSSRENIEPEANNTTPSVPQNSEGRTITETNWLVPRNGNVDMNVKPELIERAEYLAKELWGQPLIISSAFRRLRKNSKVQKKAGNGLHPQGLALDISMTEYSNSDMLRFIGLAADAGFNGIGMYNPTKNGSARYIHIDLRLEKYYWGPSNLHTSAYRGQQEILISKGFPRYDA